MIFRYMQFFVRLQHKATSGRKQRLTTRTSFVARNKGELFRFTNKKEKMTTFPICFQPSLPTTPIALPYGPRSIRTEGQRPHTCIPHSCLASELLRRVLHVDCLKQIRTWSIQFGQGIFIKNVETAHKAIRPNS